jgi:hypothetical protein
MVRLRPTWKATTYAEHQAQYLPLPSIQNMQSEEREVVSEWELDDDEIRAMAQKIEAYRQGSGPRPRVHLMQWTFGRALDGPLRPVRLQVERFVEPYETGFAHPDPPGGFQKAGA